MMEGREDRPEPGQFAWNLGRVHRVRVIGDGLLGQVTRLLECLHVWAVVSQAYRHVHADAQ
jgi:hypothetical protein